MTSISRKLLALAAVLALVAAACGDDSGDTTTTTEATTTTTEATTTTTEATTTTTTEATTTTTEATTTTTEPALPTLAEVAREAGIFTTLLDLADQAGLGPVLDAPGTFTVFAPTDDAFAALPEGTLESLEGDQQAIQGILTYHVLANQLTSEEVAASTELTSVAGLPLTITVDGDTVFVNDAQIVQADIMAANGIVHVLDAVLLPPSG